MAEELSDVDCSAVVVTAGLDVELGLDLRIDGAEQVRAARTRVLSEPSFAARAGRAKRAMLALPDLDEAVTDLEKLGA
ncbi:hypothetical protein [Allokutzneria albata]|nr:hypothetical protein [Allokutzneria albata]